MQSKTLTYYDWEDVRQFLCDAMGISEEHWRSYHKLVGGDYKDFWHVWLSIDDDNLSNDSYTTVYLDDIDGIMDYILEQHGTWVEALRPALYKLAEEVGDEINIHHFW